MSETASPGESGSAAFVGCLLSVEPQRGGAGWRLKGWTRAAPESGAGVYGCLEFSSPAGEIVSTPGVVTVALGGAYAHLEGAVEIAVTLECSREHLDGLVALELLDGARRKPLILAVALTADSAVAQPIPDEPRRVAPHVHIDRLLSLGGSAVLLIGWIADPEDQLRALRLVDAAGTLHSPSLEIRTERPDVLEHYSRLGVALPSSRCGFAALFSAACSDQLMLVAEAARGQPSRLPLPPSDEADVGAIQELLASTAALDALRPLAATISAEPAWRWPRPALSVSDDLSLYAAPVLLIHHSPSDRALRLPLRQVVERVAPVVIVCTRADYLPVAQDAARWLGTWFGRRVALVAPVAGGLSAPQAANIVLDLLPSPPTLMIRTDLAGPVVVDLGEWGAVVPRFDERFLCRMRLSGASKPHTAQPSSFCREEQWDDCVETLARSRYRRSTNSS